MILIVRIGEKFFYMKRGKDFRLQRRHAKQTKHLRSAVAEGLDKFQRGSSWVTGGGQSHDWSPGKVGVGLLNAHGIQ